MISNGSAFTLGVVMLIAGILIGAMLPRRERDQDEVAGEWGEIDRAATAAYHGAAADIAEHRRMTLDEAAAAIGRREPNVFATSMYPAAREAMDRMQRDPAVQEQLSVLRAPLVGRRPWIVLTCNGVDPEKPYVVDERGFEAIAGAPMRDVLAALGRAR